MISFLRGILFQQYQDSIVIEVNGVGYEVQVHNRSLSLLPPPGEYIFVHTYLQVLDNEFKLYGFISREELDLFKTLLGVSGIGARAALNILAAMEPTAFYQAIASGDEKKLVGIPGIGKKTAQRLLFELKDKIGQQVTVLAQNANDHVLGDVLEALESLGYNRSEVFPLFMDLKEHGQLSDRVEDNIKKILQKKALLMKR